MHSYIPKINPEELCETGKLCGIRTNNQNQTMVFVNTLTDGVKTTTLSEIADLDIYMGYPIVRSYASGHIIFDTEHKNVYLTKVEKYNKFQWQFTGGVPDNNKLSNIFIKQNNSYKINLETAEDNANMQTKLRTGVDIISSYNDTPIVDWIMNQIQDEQTGEIFWRLTLLLHYIAKEYKGNLGFHNYGNITDAKRRSISDLQQEGVAANVIPVTQKALEITKGYIY